MICSKAGAGAIRIMDTPRSIRRPVRAAIAVFTPYGTVLDTKQPRQHWRRPGPLCRRLSENGLPVTSDTLGIGRRNEIGPPEHRATLAEENFQNP